ncbi:MAG: MFS transporter [Helicobacteraceae bacterium]|nr:MFS transporter [Helicobacteraceae bacterium]
MATLIASFYFFYFSIIAIHIIFLPKVLNMLGHLPIEIGIIFASAPLVRFIVPFLFLKGFTLDAKTFNIALVILLGSAVSFLPSLNSFSALLAVNIGLGIGLSLILPYIETIALDVIGKERYGKIRLFGSVGFILVALVLVEFLSSAEVAIYFLIVVTFFTALFGFLIVKSEHLHIKSSENKSNNLSELNIFSHWKLWLGLLLMQVSFGSFYNFFTIYETANGVSLDVTIYMWTFGVVIEIVMFYFQGRFLRNNLLFILQLTTFATAIRWLLLYLYPSNIEMVFFTQAIHALSFALFHSAAISYLFSIYSQRKLAQQFFFGISYGLGGFIGAISAGYIYQYFPTLLFLSSAIVALMSWWFLYRSEEIKSIA